MSMKRILVLLLWFPVSLGLKAQYDRHIISFTDKAGTPFTFTNPSAYLSAKSINRRTRFNIPLDSTDLPITPRYLDSIRSVPNVQILNASKWMNQVAIRTTDPAALVRIQSFPFVKTVQAIAPRLRPDAPPRSDSKFSLEERTTPVPVFTTRVEGIDVNYGQTFNQVHIHNGEFLHDRGFLGQGMVIAVLDGGFSNYKTNPAFDSIRLNGQVKGEWDFVRNASNTDGFSGHGMNCLSTIAANRPGVMVGTSPQSQFYLLVTEDVGSEYPIEEHYWVCGAEYADSVGADLISSSLGYQDFDDPSFDHLYAQRDGKTTLVTRAGNLAARKGMIVMNSAGNYGAQSSQLKYISCPADGDSVVAVGAVTPLGNIAGFSSWGPSSSGKVKPNVASVGQGTIIANAAGNPVSGNGTSFANPNMAGLVSCLWQAFPEFNNMKVIDALQRSAHKFNTPDDRFGYGIPNMRTAYYLLKSDRARQQFGPTGWFRVSPNPFSDFIDAEFISETSGQVRLYLRNSGGTKVDSVIMTTDSLDFRQHQFTNLGSLPGGNYFVNYTSATKDTSILVTKNTTLFDTDWLRVYPNPFDQDFFITFRAQLTGQAQITVYDSRGRRVASQRNLSIIKEQVYNIDFPAVKTLAAGTYIVRFEDGVNERSVKVVRQ